MSALLAKASWGCGASVFFGRSILRASVLGAACFAASLAACSDLRPSAFTAGWGASSSDPAPSAARWDDDESEQNLFPSVQAPTRVYDDWRNHHDGKSPCPHEMVFIEQSYCIDKWEASLVEITPGGERPFPHNHRPEDHRVRAVSRPSVFPQSYVSGDEAQRACEMAGKRLCSEDEWWIACSGPKRTIYPYGTAHKKQACNEERPIHPMLELYGPNADPTIWYVEPMNNPAINAQQDTVSLTGSRTECQSAFGVFDMVGNVHEWTNDPSGVFRGGAYSGKIASGCQYKTTVHGFDYHDYSTGFRCCSEPWGSLARDGAP